jgi:hypothetical protein
MLACIKQKGSNPTELLHLGLSSKEVNDPDESHTRGLFHILDQFHKFFLSIFFIKEKSKKYF